MSVVLAGAAVGWWVTAPGAHRPGHGGARAVPAEAAAPAAVPAEAAASTAGPNAPSTVAGAVRRGAGPDPGARADPAAGWAGVPAAVAPRALAVAFAEALISPVPGADPGDRYRALARPGLASRLAASPGAPALAAVGGRRVVVSAMATIDDWAPPATGVAVTLGIRSGNGPPAVLGLDIHEVEVGGRWWVDGVDL